MLTDFTLTIQPVSSYKLVIKDRTTFKEIVCVNLNFHTDCEFYCADGIKQFEEYLSDWLDEVPKEEWSKERILNLVKEVMSETPFSHSMKEIHELCCLGMGASFYVNWKGG